MNQNKLSYEQLKQSLVDLPSSIAFREVTIPDLPKTISILINSIESIPLEQRKRNAGCVAKKHLLQKIYNELNKENI